MLEIADRVMPVMDESLSAELYDTRLFPWEFDSVSGVNVGGKESVPPCMSIEKARGPQPLADQTARRRAV